MADQKYRFFDYDPHEEAQRESDRRQDARDAADYDDSEDFDDETED